MTTKIGLFKDCRHFKESTVNPVFAGQRDASQLLRTNNIYPRAAQSGGKTALGWSQSA